MRDTDPGPNANWAQMCLRPGMMLTEAHENTTILCEQFDSSVLQQECRESELARPPYRIRRDTPVCVPASAGYRPSDVQFDFEKCGIAGLPAPKNMCCAGECVQGSPDTTGEEQCICVL